MLAWGLLRLHRGLARYCTYLRDRPTPRGGGTNNPLWGAAIGHVLLDLSALVCVQVPKQGGSNRFVVRTQRAWLDTDVFWHRIFANWEIALITRASPSTIVPSYRRKRSAHREFACRCSARRAASSAAEGTSRRGAMESFVIFS